MKFRLIEIEKNSILGKVQTAGELLGFKGMEFFDQIKDVLDIFTKWGKEPNFSKSELRKKGYNDTQIKTIDNYIKSLKDKKLTSKEDINNFLKIIHRDPKYNPDTEKAKIEVNTIIKALNNKLDRIPDHPEKLKKSDIPKDRIPDHPEGFYKK